MRIARNDIRNARYEKMLKLFLWLRYLRKKKIVFLSIAAVALSVSLLIAVASLFTGFINALRQAAVETVGDIVLSPPTKFAKYELLLRRLEQMDQVQAATATLSAPGLLHLGKGNVRAVNIWGIEPGRRAEVTGFKQFLRRQGRSDEQPSFAVPGFAERVGGFVGIAVVAEPDEETDEYDFAAIEKMIGEQVVLSTGAVPGAQESDSTRAQVKRRTLKFTITDIVFTGVYELDKKFVYLPIEELQEKLYQNQNGPVADQIQIKLGDNTETEVALAQIRGLWQAFAEDELGWPSYLMKDKDIETAEQMQSPYIAELQKQMGVLLVIFGVVSIGVVVLIFCIFYMIVRLKQKDIAIIKSCGMPSGSVAFVFVGFGACVGMVGSGIGVVLGYIVTKNVNAIEGWIRIIFRLKLWKSSVYMFSRIPNEVDWNSALPIVLLAIVAAAIGALIPAIVAARTRPVEILRYE